MDSILKIHLDQTKRIDMEDYIIIRPMYKTDPGYRKGMKVAILESTGEIIKRHYDNVGIHIPEIYKDIPHKHLRFDDIDWELAGYKTRK